MWWSRLNHRITCFSFILTLPGFVSQGVDDLTGWIINCQLYLEDEVCTLRPNAKKASQVMLVLIGSHIPKCWRRTSPIFGMRCSVYASISTSLRRRCLGATLRPDFLKRGAIMGKIGFNAYSRSWRKPRSMP